MNDVSRIAEFELVRASGAQGLGRDHHEHSVAAAGQVEPQRFPLQKFRGPAVDRNGADLHLGRDVEGDRLHGIHFRRHLHARGHVERKIGAHSGVDAVVAKDQRLAIRRRMIAKRFRHEARPGVEVQAVDAIAQLSREDLVGRVRIEDDVEIAQLGAVDHRREEIAAPAGTADQFQREPRLITRA